MYRDYTEILPEIFFLNKAMNVSRQLLSLPVYIIVIAKQRYGTVVHRETSGQHSSDLQLRRRISWSKNDTERGTKHFQR